MYGKVTNRENILWKKSLSFTILKKKEHATQVSAIEGNSRDCQEAEEVMENLQPRAFIVVSAGKNGLGRVSKSE